MDRLEIIQSVMHSSLDSDSKIFVYLLIEKIRGDFFNEYVEISMSYLELKIGCRREKSSKLIKKLLDDGYIIVQKGKIYGKNLTNKYCLTQKIVDESNERIDKITQKSTEKQEENMQQWVRDIAAGWLNWRREIGAETAYVAERYAFAIDDAVSLLYKVDDKKTEMERILSYIKHNEFWGTEGCPTPYCLKHKKNGQYKIVELSQIVNTKKERNRYDVELAVKNGVETIF